jgi:hypothetical protein
MSPSCQHPFEQSTPQHNIQVPKICHPPWHSLLLTSLSFTNRQLLHPSLFQSTAYQIHFLIDSSLKTCISCPTMKWAFLCNCYTCILLFCISKIISPARTWQKHFILIFTPYPINCLSGITILSTAVGLGMGCTEWYMGQYYGFEIKLEYDEALKTHNWYNLKAEFIYFS